MCGMEAGGVGKWGGCGKEKQLVSEDTSTAVSTPLGGD